MKYNIIACVNNKLALGVNNSLLYHIKDDMKHFVSLTKGNIVIMGRKTYDSIPNPPLKDRLNIVISRNNSSPSCELKENVVFVHSIDEAIKYCETLNDKYTQAFIIGGASIYSAFIKKGIVDEAYITKVYADDDGDAYFPDIFNDENWEIVGQSLVMQDKSTSLHYNFLFFQKK